MGHDILEGPYDGSLIVYNHLLMNIFMKYLAIIE